ncbi:MAG: glycosyl hydrolase [archaeon]|nr:glycosyl hydrolase [archaeon]
MGTEAKYLDKNEDLEVRVEDLLSKLTLDEKILLLRGRDAWTANPIERLNIPAFGMTDGPLGVANHSSKSSLTTRFPATIGLASTWNKELAKEVGTVIGKEVKLVGRHQILGPGVNLIRSPMCGRNFEYLSEDPVLSSDIGAEIVKGIQSQKAASCIKHYVTNCSETKRMSMSTEIAERPLQEIYIKNYKRIIEKADPWGLMCCYNKINGIYGAENKYVLREVLRDQLGFTGHVVTDWLASRKTSGATGCIKAGLNLDMPGYMLIKAIKSKVLLPKNVNQAISEGKVIEEDLDYVVRPFLRTMFRVGLIDDDQVELGPKVLDIPEHQKVAQQVAEEGMVLLKNDPKILPLDINKTKKIAILGPNATKIFGMKGHGGSSAVVPCKEITPYDGISNYVSGKVDIVENIADADTVFLVLGLNHGGNMLKAFIAKKEGDTEGRDRSVYGLPEDQISLLNETVSKNPNTVVILVAGSPVDCSQFYDKVPAILNVWYPGMMGGDAIARVIFGDVCPSGKLTVTYPKKLEDHPAHKSQKTFPGDLDTMKIHFDEGIYVGYRYFDEHDIEPFFPFGFGLSYTTFELSNISLDKTSVQGKDSFTVSVDVKNTGKVAGAEIVQIYMGDNECSVDRPPKELQGFTKIKLEPGETKTASVELDQSAFEFYSESEHKFIAEDGKFTIWAGNSSRNIPLSVEIEYKN